MKRLGIFGGSFNPIHNGHINSMMSVLEKLNLDHIIVIPTNESPGRPLLQGPDAKFRLELVEAAVTRMPDNFSVNSLEIERGGVSYTIDSLRTLQQEHSAAEFFLIIGKDQFENFENWKEFEAILSLANLVVTSRPGNDEDTLNFDRLHKLRSLVVEKNATDFALSTNKNLYYVKLDDLDVSASEIRRRIRDGESVSELVPEIVSKKIEEHQLYKPVTSDIVDYEELVNFCAIQLSEKKAFDVLAKDMRGTDRPGEFAIICSGTSRKHAASLAENLIRAVKTKYGFYPMQIEGQTEGRWIVLDYGPLIVHVFYDFARSEYMLEKLWADVSDFNVELK